MGKHDLIYKTGSTQHIPLSSEEIRATEQVTCIENFVKFGHVVFEICERTDIQTRSSQHFAPLPRGRRKNLVSRHGLCVER